MIAEENPRRDARVKVLYMMTKPALAVRYRHISGYVGGLVPPERWSKGDLINAILEIEFR